MEVRAQQNSIAGNVSDESGQPVTGAMVLEKGTANAVSSDTSGNFRINLRGNDPVLVVSMPGYLTQEMPVGTMNYIGVVLRNEVRFLENVVVVGYGLQTKASVTGSIVTLDSDELKKSPTVSVTNALTGRMSGVVTQQVSGRPGMDDANIYIRGRSSLNITAAPLVLVDGIERSFSQLDPDEIQSISVLKDASATAVYGVRGANGVILVTTKRGQQGTAKVSMSYEFGVQQIMRLPLKVDSWEHAILRNEGARNDGMQPVYTEEDISMYASGANPFTHPNIDYMGTFIVPAPQHKVNVNVSGGTDKIRYFVSLGYVNQLGIFETDVDKLKKRGSLKELFDLKPELDDLVYKPAYNARHSFNRLNLRSNIDIDVSKDFAIGLDLTYRNEILNGPNSGNESNAYIFGVFGRTPNNIPLLNENGTFGMTQGQGVNMNPFVTTANQGYRKRFKNALEGTVKLNYKLNAITKGLSWNAKASVNTYSNSARWVSETPAVWSYNYRTDTYTRERNNTAPASGQSVAAASKKLYAETSFNYNRTFNHHHVTALVLVNIDSQTAPGSDQYSNIPQIYQGIIGRVNYDYKHKYLLEVNFGYNGSNRFEKGHRYALFPAGSIGWVLTQEEFMKSAANVLSYFKLRASAGQVGNDKLGDSFEYYNEVLFEAGKGYSFGTTHSAYSGLREGIGMSNYVTWEVATKFNLGLESLWFNDRISLNVDLFYEKRTGNLTTPGQYLLAAGVMTYPSLNIGEVENRGIEIEAGWNHDIGKFNYLLKGMFTFTRNNILNQDEQLRPYDYMYRTGHRLGQQFGLVADGMFQSYDEIAVAPSQFGTLQPGDVRYRDLNGDGIINDNDITAIGYSNLPEIIYSATVGFSYKGFSASALFQGATNVSVNLGAELEWEFYNNATAMKDKHLGRWTPETASTATYHRMTQSSTSSSNNFQGSSFYQRDASYLRLKNLQVSYTFPKKWLEKSPMSRVMIYGSGYNLYTWDNIRVVDPESRAGGQYFYPQTKIFNVGINVTF